MSKYKTTPKEKMIINLMEEVINILSTCEHLSDPEFAMYEVMKHAVDKEAVSYTHLTLPTKRIV